MSVNCLLYLVMHVLANEVPFGFFATSMCCVWAKVYIAKACHKNEVARFRFPGKREVSGRLIELLDFDFNLI